jgi:hypothetical protein
MFLRDNLLAIFELGSSPAAGRQDVGKNAGVVG